MDETMALDDVRKAWDAHVALVTKALDKIGRIATQPGSDDNSAKIEEWVAKIQESNTAISGVLDALDPAPVPDPVPTPDPLPDSGDGSVA